MAMLQKYRDFVSNPKSSLVTNDVTLCYVPTNVVVTGSIGLINHLEQMSARVVRDDSRLLNVVEGTDSLSIETASRIEILYGGGAYTPELKANFVAGQTVTLPFVHIVQFQDGLISAIRLYWDQGSLLKDLDIISARGTSWPLRSGTVQVSTLAELTGAPDVEVDVPRRIIPSSPTKRVTRDLSQIMLGGDGDEVQEAANPLNLSPKKNSGKNIVPNRLHTEDGLELPPTKAHTIHQANWSFADFTAPLKNTSHLRQGQKPTFAWDDGITIDPSPEHKNKARVGTETHFEITDDINTPTKPRNVHDTRSLYHDPLFEDGGDNSNVPAQASRRQNQTSRKEFETNFEISDKSPLASKPSTDASEKPVPQLKKPKMNNAFMSSWDFGDSSQDREAPSVKLSGDGTGGPKGKTPDWIYENDETRQQDSKNKPKGRNHNAVSEVWGF